jgi:hypothetical protein
MIRTTSFSRNVAEEREMRALVGSNVLSTVNSDVPSCEEIGCEGEVIDIMLAFTSTETAKTNWLVELGSAIPRRPSGAVP